MSRREDELLDIGKDFYYRTHKYFYDANDNIIYVCKNETRHATDGVTNWQIWKYTWTAGTVSGFICTIKEGPLVGSVTGRAAMDWI